MISIHPRQLWQNAFDAEKRAGACDFDAASAADRALADAADWEVIKLTAPLPVPLNRASRVMPRFYPGA